MTIQEVYTKFTIPGNLQEHMLRVCSIVHFIEQHWTGQATVDWQFAKKMALLHDLGNIVKFKLDMNPELMGREQSRLEYWKKIQAEVIQKYGSDDHQVTRKMLEEIQAGEEMITAILAKSFGNSVATSNSNNWALKVIYYGDLRTLPFGIGTLDERIIDIRQRMPQYTSRADLEDLIAACRRVEAQIQANLDVAVSAISNTSVLIDRKFLEMEV